MSFKTVCLFRLNLAAALIAAPAPCRAETYAIKLAGATESTTVSMGHGRAGRWQVEDLKMNRVEPLKQDHHYTFVLTKLQGSPVAAALFLIGREGGKGTIPLTYSLDKTQPGLPALKVSAQEDAFKQFLAYLGSNRIQLSFKTWDGVITLPETPAKADLESKAEPAREDDEDAIIDLIN